MDDKDSNAILQLKDVKMSFHEAGVFGKRPHYAVDGLSFEMNAGETFGLVGESGCGKTTLGKIITGIYNNAGGTVLFQGKDIQKLNGKEKTEYRKNVTMVFQDPEAALNPRMKVMDIIGEPLRFSSGTSKKEREALVREMIAAVRLPEDAYSKYPHEFSGGQQQRVCIARALITRPKLIVCDEAVSALDVSVQAQILSLLQEMKKTYGLTYLFISHNLSVISCMCDKVAVMYMGKFVEFGTREHIFNNPLHPYTKVLLSSVLQFGTAHKNNKRIKFMGELPGLTDNPSGCPFHDRCPECRKECTLTEPQLMEAECGHFVSCLKQCDSFDQTTLLY